MSRRRARANKRRRESLATEGLKLKETPTGQKPKVFLSGDLKNALERAGL
jgi:hypothetical protein